MDDTELWEVLGGNAAGSAGTKDGPVLSTVSPISDWTNVFGQDAVWDTVGFQRNLDAAPYLRAMRQEAVGFSIAVQCADVKAQDIAKAEMRLWRRRGRQWVEVEPGQHWLAELLATAPNDLGHTWTEFWRMTIMYLDLTQNAYVLKEQTRAGDILGLIPIPSHRVRPRVTAEGELFYEVFASTEWDRAQLGENTVYVPADRMIHFRGRMADGISGLSNAVLGRPIFELMGAISDFQLKLFQNDGRQPIVFESDSAVFGTSEQGDAAFRRLKSQLTERVRKMNASGDPILLEAGYKAKVIAQNSRDAMTAEAYKAQVQQVCGLMRMPPHKIFQLDSIKYDNQAAMNADYANSVLVPVTKNIAEKLRNTLLPRTEWTALSPEFDQMTLLAGDPATLMDLLDKGTKIGLVSVNEARERLPLGLQPIKGGDVRLVPVGYAVVDQNGDLVEQMANGQAGNTGEPPVPHEPPQPPQPPQRGPKLAVSN